MASAGQSSTVGDVWEPRKAEIGWLYERMTLKAVKEHMEREEQFPRYSLSMWKKKVVLWRFDNKYNKRTAIEEAAAHFEQAPPDRRCVPFIPRSGKAVSESELRRYLHRSRMVLQGGRLQPRNNRGPPHTSIVSTECSTSYNDTPHTQHATQEDDEDLQSATLASRHPRPQIRSQSLVHGPLASHRRLHLQKIRKTYLFGQGIIRTSDLMVPDSIRHYTGVLKGIADSIQGTWTAGLWFIDEFGLINDHSDNFHVLGKICIHYMNDAMELHEEGALSKSRHAFLTSVEILPLMLNICLPDAIKFFLRMFISFFQEFSKKSVSSIVKIYAIFLGHNTDLHPGVQFLFSSLASASHESLYELLLQAREIWAKSLPLVENAPNWTAHATQVRIMHSVSSNDEEKGKELMSYSEGLTEDSQLHPFAVLRSFFVTGCFHAQHLDPRGVIHAVDRSLEIVEELGTEYMGPRWLADLFWMRGVAHRNTGNMSQAVGDLRKACDLTAESGQIESPALLADLSSVYLFLNEEAASRETEERYERALAEMLALRLEGPSIRRTSTTLDSDQSDLDDDGETSHQDSEGKSSFQQSEVGDAWQNYVDGHEYDLKQSGKTTSGWREDIDSSIRDHLMLSEPLLEVEEEVDLQIERPVLVAM